ncbi:MAG: HAMP domain-containing histidine kinase [Planctomyces sp.]|nr:HAMP domain-containing histidine kinase [Planctomyces sp.]
MESPIQNDERVRLQAQNTELATLAGGLAHEIRNPLSTIGMNLELLGEELEDDESARGRRMKKRITNLQTECRNLEDILNAFLQFARAGELDLEVISLNEMVSEYISVLEPQANSLGIELRPHLDSNLPSARMDRALIRQVLVNLCRNAFEAMPQGGSIDFLTYARGNNVYLEVIDTGRGMDEKTRSRMFQAFFSTRSGGSGLGLPTVRRIVEAHQGLVSCESELGKGTRFTIQMPASADVAATSLK